MSKVTAIQPQKKREGYYNVFVDEAFFCSLSDLSLSIAGLRVGQALSTQEQSDILQNSAIDKTYNRALFYLQYGPRTISQMHRYLIQKEYEPEYVETVLKKLEDQHLLNDEHFATSWVENRQLLKPRSKRQLHAELIKKGVDRQLIDEVLSQQSKDSQLDAIKTIVEKKNRITKYQDKQKMTQYLLGQGFMYSDIKTVLERN